MKSSAIPATCGIALAAMSAAGLSHWWSVRQFVAAVNLGSPVAIPVTQAMQPAGKPSATPAPAPEQPLAATRPAANTDKGQKEFYEALIAKMSTLQNQNRDLLDQLAETNRDLMKLEFRVDTHSESFRPLPVSEDRPVTSFDDSDPGVLPPRAEPVDLPTFE
jgi:hypothetical protein